MKPEIVVFDIGNVLVEWQPEAYFSRVVGAERTKAFFNAVPIHRIHHKVDEGARFSTILEAAEDYPDFESELRMWVEDWSKLTGGVIAHSVRLLRALRAKGIPVWALSNFGEEPFDISCEDHPFLTEFDGSVISGRIGVAKPDVEIYEALEEATGVLRSRLLFTDDRAENIAVAKARGWQTHLFEGPEGWAKALVEAGLLTEEEAQ
jgi:2-haloacid dehalogenase